ncbi:MAG: hypothetical protein PHQ93_06500 [Sulfurimonas sp.]|uniref:hypothetical protein n=1 Tax=Sulfurimonas sp. TaxID=2022749 RepID=UPI002625787F|nr:hypothetical protein [Sulfurimonas sp.]MDD5400816.1 hypothetical protein [Sulfurimonas sp.]
MGLDMYIVRDEEVVFSWRKTPSVHEWFRQLGVKKSIEDCDDDSFNGVKVPITMKDIKQFRKDLLNKNMNYKVQGFFFGDDSNMDKEEYSYYMEQNLKSIEVMKQELKNGKKIYYSSWW